MSPQTAVLLAALLAVLVVVGLIVRELVRAVREVLAIKRRVDEIAELPVVASLVKAGGDAERLIAATERIEPLLVRAQKAVGIIRQGPIPPDVVNAVVRIGVEVQNLREFAP